MKLRLNIFFFIILIFPIQKVSSQNTFDLSRDSKDTKNTTNEKIIGKIEFSGLNSTSIRVLSEFPVLEGDIWNIDSKNKISSFLDQLNKENIISGKFEVKEEDIDERFVKLEIRLSEQLPFFPFVLPFYSTTNGFKVKFKFWNFYSNGYPFPIEAEIEAKQYDNDSNKNLQFSLKSNDYLKLNERLSFDFDFKAYTTALHYIIWDYASNDYLNNKLKSGIEDATVSFKYKIPYIEATFIPRIGIGYGNELVKDGFGDLQAKNVYRKDIIIVDPNLEFIYPFKSLPMASMQLKAGIDFRTIYYENPNYQDLSSDQISKKTEYSIGLSTNTNTNPSENPNILDSPSYLRFNLPIPGINGTIGTGMNIAYQKNIRGGGEILSKVLIPQEYTESKFNKLLDSIRDESNKDVIRKFYKTPENSNDTKRFLDKSIAEKDAYQILTILIESGNFIRADALLLNPNIDFRFPIYNTGLTGLIGFSFDNKMYWEPSGKNSSIVDIENRITLTQTLGLEYAIPFIDANFNSYLSFYYYKRYNSDLMKQEYFIKDSIYEDSFGISRIEFVFDKKFKLDDTYLERVKASDYLRSVAGNSIKTRVKFTFDPLLEYLHINWLERDSIYNNEHIPNVRLDKFKFLAEFTHSLYLPTYKDSAFKFRSSLFATYNNIIEDFNNSSTKDIIRGNGYKYLGGWFGLILNLDYWLHLLNFNTPRIGGFSINKDLNWDMFLVFYADIGAILSDMRDSASSSDGFGSEKVSFSEQRSGIKLGSYTININNISMIPVATIGAAIRVFPRFMPMMINLEINLTPINYVIQKNFSSLFYFEFSISRSLGSSNDWFAR